jgi:hypothetical protein
MDVEINDLRTQNEFKGISFSKFQRAKVKAELIKSISNGKIEPACYWSAELICSGHYSELWEIIILYVSKFIHSGNPKLPIYISMRIESFRNIISTGYEGNEIRMRNNQKMRQLFAEIICILCQSKKKHSLETVKIQKNEEFDIQHMQSRLKSKSLEYAKQVFREDDPKELFIALNEFGYHISSSSQNVLSACYWLEWILEFEILCKKNAELCICETREFPAVQDKFKKDSIWMIWELLLNEAHKSKNKLIIKTMSGLLDMFCIKYGNGSKRRRRFIIYFAIMLLTEPINFKIEIINNKSEIDNILKNINVIYKEIKKNELSPETDYLFEGTNDKSSLDKTIEKLEKLSKLGTMTNL